MASAITKTTDREVGMVSPQPKVPYNQKCRDLISCAVYCESHPCATPTDLVRSLLEERPVLRGSSFERL